MKIHLHLVGFYKLNINSISMQYIVVLLMLVLEKHYICVCVCVCSGATMNKSNCSVWWPRAHTKFSVYTYIRCITVEFMASMFDNLAFGNVREFLNLLGKAVQKVLRQQNMQLWSEKLENWIILTLFVGKK
jgi:hypothetical protein